MYPLSTSVATSPSQLAILALGEQFDKDQVDVTQLMTEDEGINHLYSKEMADAAYKKRYQTTSSKSYLELQSATMHESQNKVPYKRYHANSQSNGFSFSSSSISSSSSTTSELPKVQMKDSHEPTLSIANGHEPISQLDEKGIKQYEKFLDRFAEFAQFMDIPTPLYKELLVTSYAFSHSKVASYWKDRTVYMILEYANFHYAPNSQIALHLGGHFSTQLSTLTHFQAGTIQFYLEHGYSQDDAQYLKDEFDYQLDLEKLRHAPQKEKDTLALSRMRNFDDSGAKLVHRFEQRSEPSTIRKLNILIGKIKAAEAETARNTYYAPYTPPSDEESCVRHASPILEDSTPVANGRHVEIPSSPDNQFIAPAKRLSMILVDSDQSVGSPTAGSPVIANGLKPKTDMQNGAPKEQVV